MDLKAYRVRPARPSANPRDVKMMQTHERRKSARCLASESAFFALNAHLHFLLMGLSMPRVDTC